MELSRKSSGPTSCVAGCRIVVEEGKKNMKWKINSSLLKQKGNFNQILGCWSEKWMHSQLLKHSSWNMRTYLQCDRFSEFSKCGRCELKTKSRYGVPSRSYRASTGHWHLPSLDRSESLQYSPEGFHYLLVSQATDKRVRCWSNDNMKYREDVLLGLW